MNAHLDVKKLVQQTQQYEFSDGLRDFQFAIMMAAGGFGYWFVFDQMDKWMSLMIDLANRFGFLGRWSLILVALIPGLLALAALLVIRYLRKRWLWRTTGYVKSARWMVPRRVTLISFLIMAVGLVAGVLLQRDVSTGDMFLTADAHRLKWLVIRLHPRRNGTPPGLATLHTSWHPCGCGDHSAPFTTPDDGQTGLVWGLVWGVALTISGLGPFLETAAADR